MRHRDPDRAAPDALVVIDEADKEIFVCARRLAVLYQEAHDFVARALRAIPRAVQRDEGASSEHIGAALLVAERGADRRLGDLGLTPARRAFCDIAAGAD